MYAYDRRGRGDSGDTPPYAADREVEDLVAVIGAAGGSADVFGHSSGAVLALDVAARHVGVTKLAVYELWMRSTVGMSEEAIAQARTEPWWPALEAVAHATPYDARPSPSRT